MQILLRVEPAGWEMGPLPALTLAPLVSAQGSCQDVGSEPGKDTR